MIRRIPYPERTAVLFVAALLFVELLVAGLSSVFEDGMLTVVFLGLFLGLPSVAGGYGFYRFKNFHPASSPEYRSWLKTTPWTPRLPLPLGPVLLRWTDLLMLLTILAVAVGHGLVFHSAIMTGLQLETDTGRILSPGEVGTYYIGILTALLLLGYLLPTTVTLLSLRERCSAYLLLFLLVLALRLVQTPVLALGSLVLALAVSQYGLRRTLESFPWEGSGFLERGHFARMPIEAIARSPQFDQVGWPYAGLAPGARGIDRISGEDALCVAALVGWTFYTVAHFKPQNEADLLLWTLYGMLVAALVAVRIVRYTGWCRAPLGVLTRLATGRLVVPGYDRVYLTPFAATALAVVLPFFFQKLLFSVASAAGLSLALVTLTVLGGGPKLAHWRLTGEWRIGPPRGNPLF